MKSVLTVTSCIIGLILALSASAFSANLSKEEAKEIISKDLSLPSNICSTYQVRRKQPEVLNTLQQNGWLGTYKQGSLKGEQIYYPSKKGKQILCDEAVNIGRGGFIVGLNSFVQDIEQIVEIVTDSNAETADVVYILGYRDNTKPNKEVSALFEYISQHGNPVGAKINLSEKQKKLIRLKHYDQGWRVMK
jgi:hypothetical protein